MRKKPLLDLLDQIWPELEPLDAHYMANKETVTKDRYLTLLAANLLDDGGLNESQSRLFDMLVASMVVKQSSVFYLQQAASLDCVELKETITFLKKDEQAGNAYLFDWMVLLRVKDILDKQRIEVLTQLLSMLSVNNKRIQEIIFWCMTMLTGHADESKDEIKVDITGDFIEAYPTPFPESRHSSISSIPYQVGDICQKDNFVIHHQHNKFNYVYHRVSHPAGMVVDRYNIVDKTAHKYLNVDGKGKLITMSIIPFLSEFKAWWPMLKQSNKKDNNSDHK
jgi:hypothetical protein